MHESSAYELIHEEGVIDGQQAFLLEQGEDRLGTPDKTTLSELRSIKDLDRLKRLAKAILKVASWRKLLDTP